jgi:hypothetical protein
MTSPIISTCANEGILPADPFTSLQLHFGMLLGVDDLETLAANPRGKTRLHQAWLHREGVVWGLGLEMVRDRGELKVNPGLAVDACGRELHVDGEQCVNLGRWFARHRNDPGFTPTIVGNRATFNAHVVLRFRACLTRAVPAMSDTCDKQELDTAYSRAYELAEVLLIPNEWEVKPLPYTRLRIFFGIAEPRVDELGVPLPDDVAIATRRDQIRAAAPETQASLVLEAFREYAALDAIDLGPAELTPPKRTLFPEGDDTLLYLGDVRNIDVDQTGDEWSFADFDPLRPEITVTTRPTHVATATIQELICGTGIELPADAGGPRITPASVTVAGTSITMTATAALMAESVHPRGFSVTTLDATTGWTDIAINSATVDAAGTLITLTLASAPPATRWLRVIAHGTGPAPLLARDAPNAPLAGAEGGPAGSAVDGKNFVYMAVQP